jgi:hypothetical protein
MSILEDGFKSLITFAADTTVLFKEKRVTPPAIVAGGKIDTTTMHNTAIRTGAPKQLYTLNPGQMVVAYDPATLPEILALVGVNTLVTYTFPDGSKWAAYGWLDEFSPGELVEGTQPEATIKIEFGCVNPSGNVETAPVYTTPGP